MTPGETAVANPITIPPLGETVGGEQEVSASARWEADVYRTRGGGGKGRSRGVRGAAAENRDLGKGMRRSEWALM